LLEIYSSAHLVFILLFVFLIQQPVRSHGIPFMQVMKKQTLRMKNMVDQGLLAEKEKYSCLTIFQSRNNKQGQDSYLFSITYSLFYFFAQNSGHGKRCNGIGRQSFHCSPHVLLPVFFRHVSGE
jgi:hypothetical protein